MEQCRSLEQGEPSADLPRYFRATAASSEVNITGLTLGTGRTNSLQVLVVFRRAQPHRGRCSMLFGPLGEFGERRGLAWSCGSQGSSRGVLGVETSGFRIAIWRFDSLTEGEPP